MTNRSLPSQPSSTEFLNLSIVMLEVLRAVSAGVCHRRDIADMCVRSDKQVLRAMDKLSECGAISIMPARDPGRAGFSVRLHRMVMTEIGWAMVGLAGMVERHRKSSSEGDAK